MNEVTNIHLGRQAFTISVEAHRALRHYLDAIERQVKDNDVVNEVELRMAELLTERGIKGDKVVLAADVKFLKDQLGDPKDFKEDETQADTVGSPGESKRFFRDAQNGMFAGVAAGVAAYFGLDLLLVRIIFVLGAIAWGGGVLVYILLWLLTPEAKTNSERLQMAGKSVTVENLKEVMDRADVKGAAKRANGTLAPVVNKVFKIILETIGVGFIIVGLASLFGLVAARTYMAAHNGQLFQENLFPVGRTEHILADMVIGLAAIIGILIIVSGVAIYKRRWPLRGWITGVLGAVFLAALAVSLALSIGVAPKVRDRYLARSHTVTRSVQPFTDVTIQGKDIDYQWEYADSYSVSFHYFDNPDVSQIKTSVSNNLLTIDTSNYNRDRNCDMLCLFRAYNLEVTVKGPQQPSTPIPDPSSPTHLIPAKYNH